MATKKRHVVYFTDEAWTQATKEAREYESTVSAYLEALVVGGRTIPRALQNAMREAEAKLHRDLDLPPSVEVRYDQRPLRAVPKVRSR